MPSLRQARRDSSHRAISITTASIAVTYGPRGARHSEVPGPARRPRCGGRIACHSARHVPTAWEGFWVAPVDSWAMKTQIAVFMDACIKHLRSSRPHHLGGKHEGE